jgi:hypothetical protein
MAKKKKGYVELYWQCPNCDGENLGSHTTCSNCGKPQPIDVDFYQGSHQQLVTDEKKLKRAQAGADIHCAYCGTRNPAKTKNCSQCSSDLSVGLHRDSAGRLIGAFKKGMGDPIECSNCGSLNPYKNSKCHNCGTALSHKTEKKSTPARQKKKKDGPKSKVWIFAGIGFFLICALIFFFFQRTSELTGVVTGVEWQRSLAIESFAAIEQENWLDQIPSNAELLSCSEEVRSVQGAPPISGPSVEVCGTPYTEETGSGFAEVVQDCQYEIYDDFCTYEVLDWVAVSTVEASGSNFSPFWPSPALANDSRFGEGEESYVCVFDVDGESYRYATGSEQEFQQCRLGSSWTITVNGLGAVVSID